MTRNGLVVDSQRMEILKRGRCLCSKMVLAIMTNGKINGGCGRIMAKEI